ncbi:flagellar basal body rod protein FlgB [Oryzomicrobium sp.]|jgi:flagellar basal-body rod protein FlgB|uniref:flagellar basal body rod protein FlgB n=1 Tax=Oryzomicrobium sp. TaxID=1911578 RepID=UPI002FE1D415
MPEPSSLFPARQVELIGTTAPRVSGTGEIPSSTAFSSILENAVSRSAAANTASSDNFDPAGKLTLGTTHSSHLPANENGSNNKNRDFQQKMLGIRAYRQQILASNIANADTPDYKAMDIEITEAASADQSPPLQLNTSSPGHLKGNSSWQSPPVSLKYHVPSQAAVDGNTVEMDVERQKFAENSLMYQFSLDRVGGEFKDMKELFQSLK